MKVWVLKEQLAKLKALGRSLILKTWFSLRDVTLWQTKSANSQRDHSGSKEKVCCVKKIN